MDSPNNYFCSAVYKSGPKKGQQCTNLPSLELDGERFCKVHCKDPDATPVKKNPNRAVDLVKMREEEIASVTETNLDRGLPGSVVTSKLLMMKVPHKTGYLTVFPNYKHGERSDGLGMPTLSPMSLGPIEHGQEDMVPAKNLENFWQGSKKYPDQTMEEFNSQRTKMFLDPIPHRHNDQRKNVKPEGWYYKGRLYTYLEARYFYCTLYEKLAKSQSTQALNNLNRLLRKGTNINIVGYDSVTCNELNRDVLLELYTDDRIRFGHEMCLACLLVLDEIEYPWNIIGKP